MTKTVNIFIIASFIFMIATLSAHEVRPSYLQLKQIPNQSIETPTNDWFDIVWKQPIVNAKRLRLEPIFPDFCQPQPQFRERTNISSKAVIRYWRITCSTKAFENQPIRIEGLSSTLTDVLLVAEFRNNKTITRLIRPSDPTAWINYRNNTWFGDYFRMGFTHFLSGLDHILFVFLLVILIKNIKSLLKIITAFTVAHSVTLAASSLNWLQLPQEPIEASIALSIIFLAYQASLPIKNDVKDRLEVPWITAFIFGLLHGFGFSSALTTLGLPDNNIVSALLLFNLGIEAGQILMIALLLFGLVMLSKIKLNIPHWLQRVPIYGIGTISCYWFLQRSALIL